MINNIQSMPMQTRSMTLKNNEKKAVARMCENIMMDLKKGKHLL